ncbi:uncharacterized protein O3C94_017300 [Discoglossus pictus]
MGRLVMLTLMVMWGVIAVSLSQELEAKKPGECPEDPAASLGDPTLPPCPAPCVDNENCSAPTCTADTQCLGSFKCCEARCGMECRPPSFRSPCRGNLDCPWTLKCCGGVCDSDCVYQPKITTPLTKGLPTLKQKTN